MQPPYFMRGVYHRYQHRDVMRGNITPSNHREGGVCHPPCQYQVSMWGESPHYYQHELIKRGKAICNP